MKGPRCALPQPPQLPMHGCMLGATCQLVPPQHTRLRLAPTSPPSPPSPSPQVLCARQRHPAAETAVAALSFVGTAILLVVGFIHILGDAALDLASPCLSEVGGWKATPKNHFLPSPLRLTGL